MREFVRAATRLDLENAVLRAPERGQNRATNCPPVSGKAVESKERRAKSFDGRYVRTATAGQ